MATKSDLISLARELGASVDGQPENVTDALPQLEALLAVQDDVHVVIEAMTALGQAWDQRAARLILDHVDVDHPNAEVRLAIARSLPDGVEDDSPCRDAVMEALITLTRDEKSAVRDSACFGLGQIEAATPEAIEALAARLTDPDDDTRCEALLALARTGDSRANLALQQRLNGDPQDVFRLELLAAAEIGDPILHPLLLLLGADWEGDDDEFTPALAFATSRCRPGVAAQATKVEIALVARVNTLLEAQSLTATLVGRYPRTALTVHDVESRDGPRVLGQIWTENDPWNYPLEQEAQSLAWLNPAD